jgi:prepilin-type N-terminal cleavage/methylation domain-containing protein
MKSSSIFKAKLARHLLSSEKIKGFTLIELLVVIVIVGVLSAVAVPTFLNQVRRSRAAEGESALATSASALTVYAFDCGTYAGNITDLNSGISCGGPESGPWLEQSWTTLAPNYAAASVNGPTSTGALLSTGGNAATAYAGITCQKGTGDQANGNTDGCTLP